MVTKFLKLHDDVEVPQYATIGAAGFDVKIHHFKGVYNNSNQSQNFGMLKCEPDLSTLILPPHSRVLIGAGFSVEIPENTQLEMRSRSGIALKQGLIVVNSPGTVDEDYRGEVCVSILNTSDLAVELNKGDRICQAVLMPYLRTEFEVVDSLTATNRGQGGLGSTGIK